MFVVARAVEGGRASDGRLLSLLAFFFAVSYKIPGIVSVRIYEALLLYVRTVLFL